MKDVVTSVQKVADVIGEITKASEEQASGIDQVNIAITEMDTVTQQNAALVEEAASAADSLLQQAKSLNYITAKFVLEKKSVLTGAARIKDKHDQFMLEMAERRAKFANK